MTSLKKVSFNSIPAPASTIDVLGSPTKSCETTLSSVKPRIPFNSFLEANSSVFMMFS